jgi:hypothetical protein
LSVRFLLCRTKVMATLAHRQKVVDLGHSAQLPLLYLSLHHHFIWVLVASNGGSLPGNNPLLPRANCVTTTFSWMVSACGFWLPPPHHVVPKGNWASIVMPWGMIGNMLRATLERSAYIEYVLSCWDYQSVISVNQNVLLVPIGSQC